MADYYDQFCFDIHFDTSEHAAQAADDLQAIIEQIDEAEWSDIYHPVLGLLQPGAPNIEIHGDVLYLEDDAGCTIVETAAEFARYCLGMPGCTQEIIIFQWAQTCSKSRVDAFGGGACLVTPFGCDFKVTQDICYQWHHQFESNHPRGGPDGS